MEKFPTSEPKPLVHHLVNRGGRLVNPDDQPSEQPKVKLDIDPKTSKPYEAVAFADGPDFVDQKDVGNVLEATAFYEADPSEVPTTAEGTLHEQLAAAGLLEIVGRIPEHDKRHVKDIEVQDLADLALAKYLETSNVSSAAWKKVKADDPQYLELRKRTLEIAQQVAANQFQKNLYVPKALTQMQLAITQAAASIINPKS